MSLNFHIINYLPVREGDWGWEYSSYTREYLLEQGLLEGVWTSGFCACDEFSIGLKLEKYLAWCIGEECTWND